MKEAIKMTKSMVIVSKIEIIAKKMKFGCKIVNYMIRVSTKRMVGKEEEFGNMKRLKNG